MQRVKELDSMRGLAAVAIVIYHLGLFKVPLLGWSIDFFFVLSGYLITSILLDNPPTGGFLISFYARRGLRIWPIYYLTLAAVVLLNPIVAKPGPLDGLPYYLTFTQNVTEYWSRGAPDFIWAFRHTWSLAVEEQYYIIWPALLLFVGRARLAPAAVFFVTLSVILRARIQPVYSGHQLRWPRARIIAGWTSADSLPGGRSGVSRAVFYDRTGSRALLGGRRRPDSAVSSSDR